MSVSSLCAVQVEIQVWIGLKGRMMFRSLQNYYVQLLFSWYLLLTGFEIIKLYICSCTGRQSSANLYPYFLTLQCTACILFYMFVFPCLQILLEPFTYLLKIAGKEIRKQLATVCVHSCQLCLLNLIYCNEVIEILKYRKSEFYIHFHDILTVAVPARPMRSAGTPLLFVPHVRTELAR